MLKSALKRLYQTLVICYWILSIVISVICAILLKAIWYICHIMGFFKEVEDNCLLCLNCKNRMEYPKILPCLHLCCRDCLKEMLRIHKDSKEFLCPKCKQRCKIPEDGIDGFRTDFQVKSMFRFLQVQEGFRNDKIQECVGCSNKMEVTSYCFKCEGYLCNDCFQFHRVNKMLTDHRQRSVALEDETVTEMSLERLASLMGIPKCNHHTDKIAEFCCQQCDNLPICPLCITRGRHKNHPVSDVNQLSKLGRKKITKALEECQKQETSMRKVSEIVSSSKKRLNDNVKLAENQIDQCEDTERQITLSKLQSERASLAECKTQIENLENKEIEEARKVMERKILEMQKKFAQETQNIKGKNAERLQKKQAQFQEKEALLAGNIDSARRSFARKREILHQAKESKFKQIQNITLMMQNRMERMQTFKDSAERVLQAKNAWTLAQHLPDIQTAGQTLLDELYSDDIDLDNISDVDIGIVGYSHSAIPDFDSHTESATSYEKSYTGITGDGFESTDDECEGGNVCCEASNDQADLLESLSNAESSDDYGSEDYLPTEKNSSTIHRGGPETSDNEIETENRKQKPQAIDEDYQGDCSSDDETESPESDSEASMSERSLSQTVKLSECEESVIKLNGLSNSNQFEVNAVAPAGNENIIITGLLSEDSSAVTVVNVSTKESRTYAIGRSVEGSSWKLFRLCAPMTDSTIVTICYRDDIGVFDVNQGRWSVSQRSIGELIDSWPNDRFVNCVTTDENNKQVIVGIENRRKLLVFDYELNYITTVNLPSMILGLRDIEVHRSNLIVCDRRGGRVYSISIQGKQSALIYKFTKPNLDEINWRPLSVTKDKNDFIYILWNDNPNERYHCIVTQYSRDGNRLLEVKEVDWNSRCLTTSDSVRGEKLLVATLKSRKVYLYGLEKQ